jgi:hypothetical protein
MREKVCKPKDKLPSKMRYFDSGLLMLNIESKNKHFSERTNSSDIAQDKLSHVEDIQYSIG